MLRGLDARRFLKNTGPVGLDLCLLGAVLLFGLSGLRSGAVRQVTHWTGLAAGIFLTGPLASRLAPLIVAHFHLPAAAARVAGEVVLFGFLSSAAALLVHWLAGHLVVEDGRADRTAGFALGAAKGGLIVFAVVSLAVFFEKPLTGLLGAPPPWVARSRAVALARRHNLVAVAPLSVASRLERLAHAARDPASAEAALAQDPQLKALLDDPALKSALQSDGVASALKSGDLSALRSDPRLAALLDDPRLSAARQP